MKILIVDDDQSLRETLAHLLRNEGDIETLEAGSLDEARELLPEADAVLSDGSFPTHPGRFDVLTVHDSNWAPLRMDCEKARIPFVLLSGNEVLVERLREAGGEAFAKPQGAVAAVRRVCVLARIHADEAVRPEDPRVQLADIRNSQGDVLDAEERDTVARSWWKTFRR
ncbi:MAG TPA: hypothetical protein VFC10_07300 [Terriglobia bacterium]|jgi:CheY-like chemotaxis protein|nr:hypothetical protein [Terracidiphilus sp.]HZT69539.1 hypothetical protein [Terriglobia bacterium]